MSNRPQLDYSLMELFQVLEPTSKLDNHYLGLEVCQMLTDTRPRSCAEHRIHHQLHGGFFVFGVLIPFGSELEGLVEVVWVEHVGPVIIVDAHPFLNRHISNQHVLHCLSVH